MTTVFIPAGIKEQGVGADKEREEWLSPQSKETPAAVVDAGAAAGQPATVQTKPSYEELEAKSAELQKQIDTWEGRRGSLIQKYSEQLMEATSGIDRLVRENADLNKRVRAYEDNGGRPAVTTSSVPKIGTPEFAAFLGPKLTGELGAELLGELFEKFTRMGGDEVAELRRKVQVIEDTSKQTRERQEQDAEVQTKTSARRKLDRMWNDVEKVAPGAHEINGDVELKMNADPLFMDYLKSRNPDGVQHMTIGDDLMTQALGADIATTDYAEAVTALGGFFNRFKDWKNKKLGIGPRPGDETVVKAPVTTHEAPKAGPVVAAADGVKLPYKQSRWNSFEKDQQAHPGKYSVDQVAAESREYREAVFENRLVVDV